MKRRVNFFLAAAFLTCIVAEQVTAEDWWDWDWPCRKKVTINSSQVPGTVTNFPVLLSLASDSDLAARAKADGSDFVVTTAAGTKCPREINTWSNETGQLQLWFKAPLVYGDTNTEFYLYYGKASATESNSTDTWDENFVAVWHFEESPESGGGADCLDSTANGNDLYADSGMVAGNLVTGEIGNAWNFQGASTDRAYAYDSDSLDVTNFTVSAWLYSTHSEDHLYSGPIHKQNSSYPDLFIYGYINRNWRAVIWDSGGTKSYKYLWNSSTSIPAFEWYCFGWSMQQSGPDVIGKGWKNTSVRGDTFVSNSVPVTTDNLVLADDGSGGYTAPYRGYMDEMQISKVVRPNNWMKACYYNWSDPSSFHTFGAEEELPAAGTMVNVR